MPAVQLNILEAISERDKGMLQALTSAESKCTGWSDTAYSKLKEYLTTVTGPFQTEEIRSYAAIDDNFPLPPHERAWGGVIRRAAFEGLITKVGIKSTRNPKAHCANSTVWIKV
jgi:hypothetical protein